MQLIPSSNNWALSQVPSFKPHSGGPSSSVLTWCPIWPLSLCQNSALSGSCQTFDIWHQALEAQAPWHSLCHWLPEILAANHLPVWAPSQCLLHPGYPDACSTCLSKQLAGGSAAASGIFYFTWSAFKVLALHILASLAIKGVSFLSVSSQQIR